MRRSSPGTATSRPARRQPAISPARASRTSSLATVRLLVANPGQEISIRQIAAEAGVAHSDLYRYATSKDQLVDLAIARLEESVGTGHCPTTTTCSFDNLETILERHARGRGRDARADRSGPPGEARQAQHPAPDQHHRRGHRASSRRTRACRRRSTRACCRHASRRSPGASTSWNPAGWRRSTSTRSRTTRSATDHPGDAHGLRCRGSDPARARVATIHPAPEPGRPPARRVRCVPGVDDLQVHDLADAHVSPGAEIDGGDDACDRVAPHRAGVRAEQHPVPGRQDLHGPGQDARARAGRIGPGHARPPTGPP